MSGQDCAAGSTGCCEAQPFGVQEHPHLTPVGLDSACRQVRYQAARGERAFVDARPHPLGLFAD